MNPKNEPDLQSNIEVIQQPSNTYQVDFVEQRIKQETDGLKAMEQMIDKILHTHRYKHEIYNWDYGFEMDDLLGKPVPFAKAELERRISECLKVDDRVLHVSEFDFRQPDKNTLQVYFTVHTTFGKLPGKTEVPI